MDKNLKEDFINRLMDLDNKELSELIKSKGKPPKRIKLYRIVKVIKK